MALLEEKCGQKSQQPGDEPVHADEPVCAPTADEPVCAPTADEPVCAPTALSSKVASYKLHVTRYQAQVTSFRLQVTRYKLHTHVLDLVPCHVWRMMC